MDRQINCRRLLELKTWQKKFAPCRRLTEEEILENVDYCMAYAETLCAKECATLQAKVATRLSIHQAELTRGGILVVHNNVVDVQSSISQFRLETNQFQREVLQRLDTIQGTVEATKPPTIAVHDAEGIAAVYEPPIAVHDAEGIAVVYEPPHHSAGGSTQCSAC